MMMYIEFDDGVNFVYDRSKCSILYRNIADIKTWGSVEALDILDSKPEMLGDILELECPDLLEEVA
jgi:hypothetical protein